MFSWIKKLKNQNTAGRVVVLIDYDNILKEAKAAGKAFPADTLKELGRRYGVVETPIVFVSHHIDPGHVLMLGRQGFDLALCPPAKWGGPDTVDNRIHSECEKLKDHPGIEIFIIVSGDRDFNKTADLLKNHRKQVVRFKIDNRKFSLEGDDGHAITLMDCQSVASSNPLPENHFESKNEFVGIIKRIQQKAVNADDEGNVWFLKQVLETMDDCVKMPHLGSQRRSFKQWASVIWSFIHQEASDRGFHSLHCEYVLDALIKHTDVLEQREQAISPKRYYAFNPLHTLPL